MFFSLLQWLESFRIHFTGRPLLLWLALLVATKVSGTWKSRGTRESWVRIAAVCFGSAAVAGYVLVAIWYATVPYYFDNAEPTVPCVAWIFRAGRPLYHTLDSAERYAHIYGPFAFITHAWALSAFGPSIQASKAVGAGSAVAAILVTLFTCRARTGRLSTATMCSGGAAIALLMFRNYSFWTRPDPLQVLSTALCLALSALNRANILSDVVAGAVAGFGWDLRFTGPLYHARSVRTGDGATRTRASGGSDDCRTRGRSGSLCPVSEHIVEQLSPMDPRVGGNGVAACHAQARHRMGTLPLRSSVARVVPGL